MEVLTLQPQNVQCSQKQVPDTRHEAHEGAADTVFARICAVVVVSVCASAALFANVDATSATTRVGRTSLREFGMAYLRAVGTRAEKVRRAAPTSVTPYTAHLPSNTIAGARCTPSCAARASPSAPARARASSCGPSAAMRCATSACACVGSVGRC